MKPALVLGEIWATRKAQGLEGHKLLLVAIENTPYVEVAVDVLDARVGDEVMVSYGSGARNVLAAGAENRQILADAAISVIVDGRNDRDKE